MRATDRNTALDGLRILELADASGMYCGKLLADMGADVVKVERPEGDPARRLAPLWRGESVFFRYMNTSKRGVVLDLDREADREWFLGLARTADVVLETFPPGWLAARGIGFETLRASNPRLVMTSITGFGQSGPRRDWASTDLVASALGGAMHVTGYDDDPPVTLAGAQAHVVASIFAASSTLIAQRHAVRSGEGQHVDISVQEAVVSATHVCGVGKWLDDGIVPGRGRTGLSVSTPSGAYACRDGLAYLVVNRPQHWKTLAEWVHEVTGVEEVLDPMFEGPSSKRQEYAELIDIWIDDLAKELSVGEFYHEGQRRGLPVTPLNGSAAVGADPHLAARRFFVELDHGDDGKLTMPGAPFRLSETPWRIARPAPRVGEHDAEILRTRVPEPPPPTRSAAGPAGGALAGLRVVEFSVGMAGPWIGRLLAHCGAEVIRVESVAHPDVVRLYVSPRERERGTQPQLSPWLTDWNAGKRCVGLDLAQPPAVELARRLVSMSDVVVENYRAGTMQKLGVGYEALREVRPDLVMIGSCGYGNSGPCRSYATWGPNIEAMSGLATLSGRPERDCTITQYAYADVLSALHGVFAVLCALEHRRRTGRGQYIDLSQYESMVVAIGHLLTEYFATGQESGRRGNRSREGAPHGCYRCRGEDRWCTIVALDDAAWRALCEVTGQREWLADPRFATPRDRLEHQDELDRAIEAWTSQRDPWEVMGRLQEAGVTAGVVQNVEDLYRRDPQLAAREFFETIEHWKRGSVVATGIPFGLTGTPGRSGRAGAAVGQDNDYVFGELLGMSRAEIETALAAGTIERG